MIRNRICDEGDIGTMMHIVRCVHGFIDPVFECAMQCIRAKGYLTSCVVTKGIKADCKCVMRTYNAKR